MAMQAIPSRAEITPNIVNAKRNVSTISIAPTLIKAVGMRQPYANQFDTVEGEWTKPPSKSPAPVALG
jgi:hypothetical protein